MPSTVYISKHQYVQHSLSKHQYAKYNIHMQHSTHIQALLCAVQYTYLSTTNDYSQHITHI